MRARMCTSVCMPQAQACAHRRQFDFLLASGVNELAATWVDLSSSSGSISIIIIISSISSIIITKYLTHN